MHDSSGRCTHADELACPTSLSAPRACPLLLTASSPPPLPSASLLSSLSSNLPLSLWIVFLCSRPTQDTVEDNAEAAPTTSEPVAPDDFSDLKKKKKKSSKKAAFDLEAFERELKEEEASAAGGANGDDDDAEGAVPEYGENELGDNVFGGAGAGDAPKGDGDEHQAWIGTDRDYTYEEVRLASLSSYL